MREKKLCGISDLINGCLGNTTGGKVSSFGHYSSSNWGLCAICVCIYLSRIYFNENVHTDKKTDTLTRKPIHWQENWHTEPLGQR